MQIEVLQFPDYSLYLTNWSKGRGSKADFGNYFWTGSKVEPPRRLEIIFKSGRRSKADGELGWSLAGIGSRWDGISLGRGLAALRRPIGG